MAKITYEDKVDVLVSSLPNKNKINAGDMNQIKKSVNELETDMANGLSEAKIYTDTKIDNLVIGGRNIVLNSNARIVAGYGSPTISHESNIIVSEWSATDARRVYGKSGTNKIFGTLVTGRDTFYALKNKAYVFSIYVKNNHTSNLLYISANGLTGVVSLSPGEAKRVVIKCVGNGTSYLSTTFQTATTGIEYDFTYWHYQIEEGTIVSDWSPAPEDLDNSKVNKSGDTMTGDLKFGSTLMGICGKDKNGVQYPFVYDNGGNFWLGASGSTGTHHTGGGTYISGGEGHVYTSRLIDGVRTNSIIIDTKNMGSQLVTTFPSGANLDDYKTAGFYRCNTNTLAQSLLNCPTTQAFSMTIETHAGAKQTITTYSTSGQVILTRNCYSNVWGAWRELAFVDDSGWISLDLINGFTSYQGATAYQPICRKVGKTVDLVGQMSPPANSIVGTTTQTAFCVLPIGCRPNRIRTGIMQGSSQAQWLLTISTNGNVLASRYADGAVLTTPASTAWMTIDVTFTVD